MLVNDESLMDCAVASNAFRKKEKCVILAEVLVNDKQEVTIPENRKDNACILVTWPEYRATIKGLPKTYVGKDMLLNFDRIQAVIDAGDIPFIISIKRPDGTGSTAVMSIPYPP
jgi:hypothetical protein